MARLLNQEKTSVVGRIVFDAGGQHLSTVGQGSLLAGDGAGLFLAQADYMLHAARGVVEGGGRHLRMLVEKSPALGQRDGVGEDLANILDLASRHADEIVADAQQGFPFNLYVGLKEKVEVFDHRTGERIFDGDDCGANLGVLHVV